MSTKFSPVSTNRTPWLDEITLIKTVYTEDQDGYGTSTETEREISCTFSEGVARGEFYEAMKAGMMPTATAEVWEEDYQDDQFCEFDSVRYKIIRTYPSGRGTTILIMEKVIR